MQFLVAHTNSGGLGVAQKTIEAKSEAKARELFRELFPERVITVVGVKGVA